MHWDHELVRVCSADFPACGFTGHSCPVFLLLATGKSPEPADRNVCFTHPRFMESPLSIVRMHWDHEPKMRNLFICKGSILRFMERFRWRVLPGWQVDLLFLTEWGQP